MAQSEKEPTPGIAGHTPARPSKAEFGPPLKLIPDLPLPTSGIPVHKEVLEKGQILFRCHDMKWTGKSFNPGRSLYPGDYGARFSPFSDAAGKLVSYLYAADSVQGALSETIFHDLIGHVRRGFLNITPWREWGLTRLKTERELTLVTLKTADLYRMGLSKETFILGDRLIYAQTRQWAKAMYDQNKDVDGYVWKSRQHDDSDAYILFGNRITTKDLSVLTATAGLFASAEICHEIKTMARRLGIILTDE